MLSNKDSGITMRVLFTLLTKKQNEVMAEGIRKKKQGWYYNQLRREINSLNTVIKVIESTEKGRVI
tara:strand:+ start:312 stop:509 length:198 start_codon:yes stop_codon:yes gene_type:complete